MWGFCKPKFLRSLMNQAGSSTVEYTLMLSLIAVVAIPAVSSVGGQTAVTSGKLVHAMRASEGGGTVSSNDDCHTNDGNQSATGSDCDAQDM